MISTPNGPGQRAGPSRPRLDVGHRVLVAGATGTLGRHIVAELLRSGAQVRALVRDAHSLRAQSLGPVELVRGDVLDRATLAGACDGIDVVISAAGASMRLGGLADRRSFMEVDFGGNANLLEVARTAGVSKFVYVSIFGARDVLRTEYAAAHERFVGALACSGIPYSVIRPTGFHSFFAEFVTMASRGRVMLIGDGSAVTNPVDEQDVAELCVEAILSTDADLPLGGPDTLSRRRIAELAFEAVGRPPRITSLPIGVFQAMTRPVSLINPRLHALCAFGAAVSAIDVIAPRKGRRSLADYFKRVATRN